MKRGAVDSVLAQLAEGTPERPVSLGRYAVVGRLGRGGMGTVYAAVDRERGTKVALKTLTVASASAGVSLKREFRVVADLAHPNLAPVYELASDRGVWFFTMEQVDGVTLIDWARKDVQHDSAIAELPLSRTLTTKPVRPVPDEATRESDGRNENLGEASIATMLRDYAASLPVRRAGETPTPPDRDLAEIRSVLAEIVSGIGALHGAGLRHGDVKPSNVLVRGDSHAVLVDFGLARPLHERQGIEPWSGGTPTYMPPEQITGKGGVGPEADWYALGATLYRVLTGCLPFWGNSQIELYFRKMHCPPPSPHELLPSIPEDLSELCMALMRPDPKLRPSEAEVMRVLSGEPGAPEVVRDRPSALFVGRDAELCALEEAYGRARAGQLTVVHTHGPSGIGKSALLGSFLDAVQHVDSASVLKGRCYERESVPHKAFDRIVDELAERLQQMDADAVDGLLPSWTAELAQVFPALASVPVLAKRSSAEPPAVDKMELRRRAWVALADLLRALRTDRPMVLAIDDLQWADADSANLLEMLLRGAEREALLVVILFRPADAAGNPALESYFELCRKLDAEGRLADLALEGLSPADGEQLARAALGEAATQERVSFVAKEGHGVPFFIEELAHYVAERGTAAAGEEVSLDEAILARLGALDADQRTLVEIVALANSPLPQSVAFEAAKLDAGALRPLLALRRASLVSWGGAGADDVVSAYHDRIRESVVAALPPEVALCHHLALGRALARRSREDVAGPWMFDAVRHLGAAESLLSDPAERLAAARLHVEAGDRARNAAAYPLAFSCFEGGIALLPEDAWESHYELALELYTGAVEAAYLTASWSVLERRIAQVKSQSRHVMDQLVAWEAEIDARAGRHDYVGAVDAGLSALGMLGVDLPRDPTEAEVGAAVQRTLACLTEIGPEGLNAMPDLTDPAAAAATRIQVRVSPAAYFGKPTLLPIIACNLVLGSVERGVSTATPYALALFGIVLNTIGQYSVSHTWGQLALGMLDRWPDRRLEAATRHILLNLVCCWMVPLSSILRPLREVFDIGCRTGDYEYASYAAHGYTHNAMYAGRPLEPLLEEALTLGEQMRALGQVNALHVHTPFEQLLKALTGRLTEPHNLDGEGFDEARLLAEAESEGSRSGQYILHLVKGLTRYHFGKPVEASACLEKARTFLDAAASVWHQPIMHQFAALAACGAWEQADDEDERRTLRGHIDESLEALRTYAELTPVNFAHRVSLVEGELRRLLGEPEAALAKLEQAIAQAQEGSWINDIALANEICARCHGDRTEATRCLRAARTGYAAWGARAKVEQMTARIAELS